MVRKKKKNLNSSHPRPFLPDWTSLLHSQLLYLPTLRGAGLWGIGVWHQTMTAPLHCSFLLILFPCSILVSPGTALFRHSELLLLPPFSSHPGARRAVSHTFFHPQLLLTQRPPSTCTPTPVTGLQVKCELINNTRMKIISIGDSFFNLSFVHGWDTCF